MRPDEARPENAGVLTYLARHHSTTVDPSPDEADRLHLGTHPDVVARLWDELANAFSTDARAVVLATPVLIDPSSRVIVAVGLGTTYALRLGPDTAGRETVHHYTSVGRTLDLTEIFGAGWVFGTWAADEVDALRRTAATL
jgi:hypothetical protein